MTLYPDGCIPRVIKSLSEAKQSEGIFPPSIQSSILCDEQAELLVLPHVHNARSNGLWIVT